MVKRFLKVIVAIAVVLTAWYFVGQYVLEKGTNRGLSKIQQPLGRLGIDIEGLSVEETQFSLPANGKWTDIKCIVNSGKHSAVTRNARFSVSVESASINPSSLLLNEWNLRFNKIEANSMFVEYPNGTVGIGELWLSIDYLEKGLAVDLTDPKEAVRDQYQKIDDLFRNGALVDYLDTVGTFGFKMNGTPVRIRFESEKRGDSYGLRANMEDVLKLSKLYSIALTEAELGVISKYPIQSPTMLQLQKYSTDSASEAHKKDGAIPEDAYRHLLWSFLLTKEFGLELSKEITDAHEIGSTTNTAADHYMDYRNNELGRQYAVSGYRESDILSFAKTDPDVVRQP